MAFLPQGQQREHRVELDLDPDARSPTTGVAAGLPKPKTGVGLLTVSDQPVVLVISALPSSGSSKTARNMVVKRPMWRREKVASDSRLKRLGRAEP